MHLCKAENNGLYLKLNATNMPELTIIDNNRLTQVMVNLICNALKFTHTGGVIVNAIFKESH